MAQALQGLSSKIKKDIAFAAMVKAVQPTVAAARELTPVDTGGLRQSIGFAVRQYKRGSLTYGIIGPRFGFGIGGREPANYAHLIEYGHLLVTGGTVNRKDQFAAPTAKNTGTAIAMVEPKPFLRPAWEATKASVLNILGVEMGAGVEAAAAEVAAKNAKRAARNAKKFSRINSGKSK